jgi:GDP-4-dehydro-6-deoxy-D-mannose reductase
MALKVLVTGASGFVGRHLGRLLAAEGLDLHGTCYPDKPCPADRQLVHLDLRSAEATDGLLERVKPDWVIHLAAVSNVRRSWENRKETLETNVVATGNLFEAVRKFAPRARVLFISSSDVYGLPGRGEHAFREDDPVEALSPYAYTKLAGELLCRFYVKVERLDIVVARPFPHTGPGQTADFVFPDWASQIARIEKGLAEPVIRVGNLEVRRDYADVRDVVRAYLLLLRKGRSGETYNVCTGRAVFLKDILAGLAALASKPVRVEVDPAKLRKTDIPFLAGDGSKIRRETGWEAEIPLDRTLRDLVESWRRGAAGS